MKIAAIDTETTSFLYPFNVPINRQPRIIEICICFFDDEEEIEEDSYFTQLVNPGFAISKTIQKVTGLTPNILQQAPPWKIISSEVKKRIESADRLVAHNLYFDLSMIQLEERRLENDELKIPTSLFCTNEYSEHFFGKRLKMSELYVYLTDKEVPKKIHRAQKDVELLVEVYKAMKEMGLAEEIY